MTAEMAQLQADFAAAPDLRLVSITVDPDRDTAAVLAQYAARFEADPERWLFLTGEKRSIHQLATEGFRLGIIDPTEASQGLPGKGQAVRTSAFGPRSQSLLIWETIAEHASSLLTWLPTLTPAPVWADHGQGRDIGHSSRFVLIDRQGRIRGYYQSRDDAELQRLRRHTAGLLRGP
jgi:cytochrome oxidase Cu insertion factor (SCO1/SenC/PrrC family)